MEEVSSTQPETKIDPLKDLALAAQGGDSSAVAALWESVERFVKMQARRRFHIVGNMSGVELDDLCQLGFRALVEAIDSYDPTRGS